MKLKTKIITGLLVPIIVIFFIVKILVLVGNIESSSFTRITEFVCVSVFIPLFYLFLKEHFNTVKDDVRMTKYSKKLNKVLISQSHNSLFYQGKVKEGAEELTKEVANTINSDRCSIWLYNEDKTSIKCQKLYVKSEDKWYDDIILYKTDFKSYFENLEIDPIIIAHDAEQHKATKCFTETYLRPLGIKSMLDVPILYKGEVIGVVCIESFLLRKWRSVEITFAQLLSSLYSFSYSVKQSNTLRNELIEFGRFVDSSVLVSKADNKGKIIYVNKKFENVSGWKLDEVIGKDHKIVNSGEHNKEFWTEMYDTTINKKQIWNSIVTNKSKNGDLYWVDSYIKADFNEEGVLSGFMSIRYDITEVIKAYKEIEKKNTYLEHSAKILRHDMHSGINTYIPRGITSLERRLSPDDIKNLKIEAPLKMIKEGLIHTQKVYRGVYEFTNLVKKDAILETKKMNLKSILDSYLNSTAYKSQVIIDDLGEFEVNESLFCTAVDNLIRNGLKYNDSETKFVKIYFEKERKRFGLTKRYLVIQDNGRGMTQEDLNKLSKPYVRKEGQKESGSGLGLNICIAILEEHGFKITCEKNEIGTKIKIKIK